MIDKTTITISKGLKEKLEKFGSKRDTFEDIIRRLVEYYEEGRKNEESTVDNK